MADGSRRFSQSFQGRERAQHWDRNADVVIPKRQEMLDLVVSIMAASIKRDEPRVIDLGGGTGSLAEKILQRWPQAQVTCVDKSPEMLELGREKHGEKIGWLECDLSAPDWAAKLSAHGPFDVVVSSLALHLIPDEAKLRVHRWSFEQLAPGGVLVCADRLRAATPELDAWYQERWMQHIVRRTKEVNGKDVPLETVRERQRSMDQASNLQLATLEQNLDWLRQVGFAAVECFWKNERWAVFGAF